MNNVNILLEKTFIEKSIIELKRRPDKLSLVRDNINTTLKAENISENTYKHLDELKVIIENSDNNIHSIEKWITNKNRNPKGYKNWVLAFKNLT